MPDECPTVAESCASDCRRCGNCRDCVIWGCREAVGERAAGAGVSVGTDPACFASKPGRWCRSVGDGPFRRSRGTTFGDRSRDLVARGAAVSAASDSMFSVSEDPATGAGNLLDRACPCLVFRLGFGFSAWASDKGMFSFPRARGGGAAALSREFRANLLPVRATPRPPPPACVSSSSSSWSLILLRRRLGSGSDWAED